VEFVSACLDYIIKVEHKKFYCEL